MIIAALTDVGRGRTLNEDNYFVYQNDNLVGGMVADGMGGHNAGEVASAIAADLIKNYIIAGFDIKLDYIELSELIKRAYLKANQEIFDKSKTDADNTGMGTTATLAMVYKNKLITAHVGDSRVYVFDEDGVANRVTTDHSLVEELVQMGEITPEEAKYHPQKNLITRALGIEPTVKVDINVSAYRGEPVMICSDGLSNMISEGQMTRIINSAETMEQAVSDMVEAANNNGGSDNITCIMFSL